MQEQEIEITPEMVEAGRATLEARLPGHVGFNLESLAEMVFRKMALKRPPRQRVNDDQDSPGKYS